jgi:two-component sensor histidine kinase
VRIWPNAVATLVLVLHELATNSVKYGALSNHSGCVALNWSLPEEGRMELTWQETGGPPVSPPTRTGYGSRLITRSVTRQLEGEVDLDYAATGLTYRLAFPLRSARSSGELS